MAIDFKGSNAVVLAPPPPERQFDPAKFSQIWMIQQLHVDPNDFVDPGAAVHAPFLFNQATTQFNLLVVPERIQLMFAPHQEEGGTVKRVMLESLLQVTRIPYSAAGLNFNWLIHANKYPNSVISRKLFFAEGNPFFREFDTPNACFGAYASKDYLGTRLRVDAKPLLVEGSSEVDPRGVLFNFNFHKELVEENRLDPIRELLDLWDQARAEASRIIEDINAGCGL